MDYTELAQILLRGFFGTPMNIGLHKDKQNTYLLKDNEIFKGDPYLTPRMRDLIVQLTVIQMF